MLWRASSLNSFSNKSILEKSYSWLPADQTKSSNKTKQKFERLTLQSTLIKFLHFPASYRVLWDIFLDIVKLTLPELQQILIENICFLFFYDSIRTLRSIRSKIYSFFEVLNTIYNKFGHFFIVNSDIIVEKK